MTKLKLFFLCIVCSGLIFGQSNSEIKKLEDFAKMYSVVRHFHPSDESANFNWDLFAMYGVEEILKTKNQKEFEIKIKELFLPLAPSVTYGKNEYQWDKTGTKPVYWVNKGLGNDSQKKTYDRKRKNVDSIDFNIGSIPIPQPFYTLKLSNNFSPIIPLIVYSKNNKTFPEGNLNGYQSLKSKTFDRNTALANMIIMWSGLRHFFPYQDEMKLDWDKILKEGLISAYQNKNEEENYFTLRKISHYFNDGHMWISYPDYFKLNYFSPGIKTRYMRTTKQLVVTKILGNNTELKKGDIITKIDDKNVESVIDSIKQYWSGSDHYNTQNAVKELFKGKENTAVSISLDNGNIVYLKRDFNTMNQTFFSYDNEIEMQELRNNVLYINLQNLKKITVESKIDYIKSFGKIIIDIRGYPKTSNGGVTAILATFFPDRNKVKFMSFPKIENPFYNDISYSNWKGWDFKKKEELNAKIVLLVNEGCGSFQESIAQYIKGNNYATLIGRPTGGVNGNINRRPLLNTMGYSFTGMKVRNPDGSLFHTIGVQPDIVVEDNLEDIKNGKDTFIEKAIDFLNMK
ncbi:Peptidase family S41 [Chryseobacterium ureilyticum]|uniref:Peptidase family S41 n=1 Tax=Chryseobacterium ureilyticum TaxID=373668 RepID=A0A1N7LYR9_9FLAO|nr:S41 family peptidase [Chryseobacterium ureilyticum]SIS78995.1 Peptidase family S41 [Chryseobacterium ureilyticum]